MYISGFLFSGWVSKFFRVCVNLKKWCFDLDLWCVTPLSTIFPLYRGGQFLLGEETKLSAETLDLLQVTDNLYHIMFYHIQLAWAEFELTILEVITTDNIGSCKFNHHTITTLAAHGKISNIYNNLIAK